MIECVIFDCDGTLVDSEVICNLGLKIKLQEIRIQADIQSMVNQFRGFLTTISLALMLSSLGNQNQICFYMQLK